MHACTWTCIIRIHAPSPINTMDYGMHVMGALHRWTDVGSCEVTIIITMTQVQSSATQHNTSAIYNENCRILHATSVTLTVVYYTTRYLTSTVSAVFEHNVSLTDIFASFGTPVSCTSLSTLFFLASPAARALANLALLSTSTSTFNTLAQLAAPSSCAHSSSLNSACRYKPQHRGTEVTPYKNNKHCTSGMASGEVAVGHKMAVQQAHEMGGLHAPTLGEAHIYTHV